MSNSYLAANLGASAVPPALVTNDDVLAFIRREPVSPVVQLFDAYVESLDIGSAVCRVRFEVGPAFCNAAGFVMGGQLCAMLDFATSLSVLASERFTMRIATLELKTSFLKPAKRGKMFCDARTVQKGGSIAFLAGELFDADGTMVASATSTARLTPLVNSSATTGPRA